MHAPPWAGLLATAGGLVFGGAEEGDFFALHAHTGAPLWRFQTGGQIIANPMTYLSGGRQYIASPPATPATPSRWREAENGRAGKHDGRVRLLRR